MTPHPGYMIKLYLLNPVNAPVKTMEYQAKYITEHIKLSSYPDKFFKSDILFEHHMLIWFISGETKIVRPEATHHFSKGDIFLIPRNQLATILNYPKDGQPHKTIVMHLTADWLKKFYSQNKPQFAVSSKTVIRQYNQHPLLESCLASLIPYFNLQELPADLADLKIKEAVTILRTIDPGIDDILANFADPGKIDLAGYMERNFMFNLPLERFSHLTGRSLTTFKKDFRKIYGISPQRWLIRKRLELAHFELSKNKKKPLDVCYEVGFENLSHFSFTFKKQFGYPPSRLVS